MCLRGQEDGDARFGRPGSAQQPAPPGVQLWALHPGGRLHRAGRGNPSASGGKRRELPQVGPP